jgi:hypothetical protein
MTSRKASNYLSLACPDRVSRIDRFRRFFGSTSIGNQPIAGERLHRMGETAGIHHKRLRHKSTVSGRRY